jgi:hypothetical protein
MVETAPIQPYLAPAKPTTVEPTADDDEEARALAEALALSLELQRAESTGSSLPAPALNVGDSSNAAAADPPVSDVIPSSIAAEPFKFELPSESPPASPARSSLVFTSRTTVKELRSAVLASLDLNSSPANINILYRHRPTKAVDPNPAVKWKQLDSVDENLFLVDLPSLRWACAFCNFTNNEPSNSSCLNPSCRATRTSIHAKSKPKPASESKENIGGSLATPESDRSDLNTAFADPSFIEALVNSVDLPESSAVLTGVFDVPSETANAMVQSRVGQKSSVVSDGIVVSPDDPPSTLEFTVILDRSLLSSNTDAPEQEVR